MKVLLSGYHNPHFITITEYMEDAISELGHELVTFDDRHHIIPGRIRRWATPLHQLDLKYINRRFVSLALKETPDIVIVTGGHRIKSSSINILKEKGIITVLWTIDAPVNFQPIIDAAPFYDHIFCQGSEAIELLDQAGIKGANWLPVACSPKYHRPVKLSAGERNRYGSDLCFVGSYYPNRAELFERLSDFDFGIWGPGWEKVDLNPPLRSHICGRHTPPSTWLKIFSSSKIVLSVHYKDPLNRFPVYQASPRIFEALACGSFVVSDKQKDVLAVFNEGEHLVYFDAHQELIKKIKYYLGHESERKQIALKGMQEALKNHTYAHRIKRLLSLVAKEK